MVRAIQNKVFYRLLFKKDVPDWNTINGALDNFQKAETNLHTYFMGKNDFIGGKELNICDLIATSTFEQVKNRFIILVFFG